MSAHRCVNVYAAGGRWWARCRLCRWESEVVAELSEARAAGRAHEAEPEPLDWSIPAEWLRR